jgi:hypothetical protein
LVWSLPETAGFFCVYLFLWFSAKFITQCCRLQFKRNGQAQQIDDLAYTYKTGSNQLDHITDISGSDEGYTHNTAATTNYAYDANGNMTKDILKGITNNITYNYLNLPTQIDFGSDRKLPIFTMPQATKSANK